MHLGRGRAADEKRYPETLLLELLRHVDHFVERRCNETRQADDVRLVLLDRRQNLLRGTHHPKIDDAVVVAAQHHAYNVLADVMDIALDGGNNKGSGVHVRLGCDLAAGLGLLDFQRLLLLHEGNENRHRLLHDAGRLDDLRQKHLARAEQITDNIHAVHQGPLNNLQGPCVLLARLLSIGLHKLVDALHEGVLEPLLHRLGAPLVLLRVVDHPLAVLAHRERVRKQVFRRLRILVKNNILDEFQKLGVDVRVHRYETGVDDSHVDSVLNAVVQKGRVHSLAELRVAAEGKRHVGDTAGDVAARERFPQNLRRLEEVDGVLVVLFDARGDGKNVGVENDVVAVEPDLIHQNPVRAGANPDLVLHRSGLAHLVERHDNHRRAVPLNDPRVPPELILAGLERNRVDDALPLQTLQPLLHHLELRRVHHDRHLRDVRLGREEVAEAAHGGVRVQQTLVEIDVDDLRAVLHLLDGDFQHLVIVPRDDVLLEGHGARHVAPLPNVDEFDHRGVEVEGLQPAEAQHRRQRLRDVRLDPLEALDDRGDVRRGGTATTANNVDEALVPKRGDLLGHVVRALVVAAHRVGQPRVGVRDDVGVGAAAEALDVRLHVLRA
mmetsp:Transcript_3747/g.9780  ORF Transcript_3747/g.9780 Transcript_3747/m.9780 type:complete len:609 (+) Transcript_3747:1365-3191(+)